MLDITLALLSYAGVRLYEKHKKYKAAKATPENSKQENKEIAPTTKTKISPEERKHYQKMSAVTMGTAALRMLHISPVFIVINIGTYTYTMLPFYREVEEAVRQRLLKKGEVDSYVVMGIGNLLLLSMNRYFTASVGLGLSYISDSIRAKAKETAQQQLSDNIFDSLFDPNQKVWIIKEGVEFEISLDQVEQNDVLAIKAGETIPVDGLVLSGMASVDQHAFTGESYPVEKGEGEQVFASTLMLTIIMINQTKFGIEQ